MDEWTSQRRLADGIGLSLRTVGRWIRKAIHRAPLLGAELARICYEYDPALPVDTQVAVGPAGDRGIVAGMFAWAAIWKERMPGPKPERLSRWEAANTVGPLQGALWF